MVTKTKTLLNNATATGTSTTLEVLGGWFAYEVNGITDATVITEVSNDESTWVTAETRTSDGGASSNDGYPFVRQRVSAYSAGTISSTFSYDDGSVKIVK